MKEQISDYEIFSIPKEEVEILEKYQEWDYIIIKIKWINNKQKCPKCWWYNTEPCWKYTETIKVNHMFLSNYKVVKLEIEKRRFKCRLWEKSMRERNR
jgi:hypothetical protein